MRELAGTMRELAVYNVMSCASYVCLSTELMLLLLLLHYVPVDVERGVAGVHLPTGAEVLASLTNTRTTPQRKVHRVVPYATTAAGVVDGLPMRRLLRVEKERTHAP